MRRERPALIYHNAQFADAIRNAYELYQYGLAKKYVVEKVQKGEISFTMSGLSLFTHQDEKVPMSQEAKTLLKILWLVLAIQTKVQLHHPEYEF
jgi:hypothetical protein